MIDFTTQCELTDMLHCGFDNLPRDLSDRVTEIVDLAATVGERRLSKSVLASIVAQWKKESLVT